MEKKIVECVPNFSEGRNQETIRSIARAIEVVDGVRLLGVEAGAGANRTVMTFAGEPEAVCEAAFHGAATAAELIDMRLHLGEHPRLGATDVLPLVPVSGISLEECAVLARRVAERLASEVGVPCYLYEAAALRPERRLLAACRKGEYEGLARRLCTPAEAPDIMPPAGAPCRVERTGCTIVGARKYLVAVNFTLDTTSTDIAREIALDIRERGRGPERRGLLKSVRAIGWYIEEYGRAQVSCNLTDIDTVPLHEAFEAVCQRAAAYGVSVTGTEIIGLVPRRVLTEAGLHFGGNSEATDGELISIATEALRLCDLRPFVAGEKVIEMRLSEAE